MDPSVDPLHNDDANRESRSGACRASSIRTARTHVRAGVSSVITPHPGRAYHFRGHVHQITRIAGFPPLAEEKEMRGIRLDLEAFSWMKRGSGGSIRFETIEESSGGNRLDTLGNLRDLSRRPELAAAATASLILESRNRRDEIPCNLT